MARRITVEDDDTGVRARISTDPATGKIAEVTLSSLRNGALPENVVAALLPHIGLPAIGGSNGNRSTARPAGVAAATRQIPTPAAVFANRPASAPAFQPPPATDEAERDGDDEDQADEEPEEAERDEVAPPDPPVPAPTPDPATPPEPAAETKSGNPHEATTRAPRASQARPAVTQPTKTANARPYRRYPGDKEMADAIKSVSAAPSKLAKHFNVPAHTINGWLTSWRRNTQQPPTARR